MKIPFKRSQDQRSVVKWPQRISAQIRNTSIAQKLPLFVMFSIIITVCLTVGTTLFLFLQYNQTVAEKNVRRGISGLKISLDDSKNKALNYASVFAIHPNVMNAIAARDTAAIISYLSPLAKKAHIDFVTVTDANGIVLARIHDPSNNGDSITNQFNIRMALKGKAVAAVEKGTAVKFSARAGAPVRDGAGAIIGVISAGYRLDKTEIVDNIKKVFQTDATIFFNNVRLSTTIKQNGHRVIGTRLEPRIAKTVLENKSKYLGKTDILGLTYITAYMPLLGPDGRVMGALFAGESMKNVYHTNNIVLISVILITFLLIVSAYFMVRAFLNRNIIHPLKTAAGVLKQVAAGNLTTQIPESEISGDEIGQLLSSLKIMVENVKELIHQIHDLGETVAAAAQEMMSSSEEITKAGEHVAGAINDLAKEASEQALLTEKGNAKIKAIVIGLNQITTDMKDSERMAATAWENVNHGHKAVQIQENKMDESKRLTTTVNTSIDHLRQMSSEIEEILSAIRGVAEQTSLLAINAAIEAARAKEQGRGFAVVAQQVKSLSEQSGNSVEKIGIIVQTLQTSIGQIVEEMNQVESATDEGEQSMHELIPIFQNVSDSVEVIATRLKTVSQAAAELTQNANHAGSSIEEIAGIAEETASGSEEVSASSEEQTAYMQQIVSSAENLAKAASELLGKINHFQV